MTPAQRQMKFHIRNHLDELTEISNLWFKYYVRHGLKVNESLFYEHRPDSLTRYSYYYIVTADKQSTDMHISLQRTLGEKPITTRKLKI